MGKLRELLDRITPVTTRHLMVRENRQLRSAVNLLKADLDDRYLQGYRNGYEEGFEDGQQFVFDAGKRYIVRASNNQGGSDGKENNKERYIDSIKR